MNIKRKIALAAIPAVMALSATDVSSKVLLIVTMVEVSFDGAANAFYNHTSTGTMDTMGAFAEYTTGGETAASTILGGGESGNAPNGVGGDGGEDISSISAVYYQMFGVLQ